MSGPIVLALRLLLAISLYAFLGWAFFSLWREIQQQGAILGGRKAPPIHLTIAHAGTTAQVRHFYQSEVTIGRDPVCECPVDDETISSHHARLSYHHHQWWLEDLDSTNGIHLNKEKLSMPAVVMTDDEFVCGKTFFKIAIGGDVLVPPTKII